MLSEKQQLKVEQMSSCFLGSPGCHRAPACHGAALLESSGCKAVPPHDLQPSQDPLVAHHLPGAAESCHNFSIRTGDGSSKSSV